MAKVLLIDDDKMICEVLSAIVRDMGHEVRCAYTLGEGLRKASSGSFDVVFLDVGMPDGSGLDALPAIRKAPSSPEVIIMTGLGDPEGAELAIKNDAWDYIEKRSSIDAMALPLVRALQYREEKKARRLPVALKREGIVGDGPKMKACLDLVAQAAGTEANVLITGETGTGKELVAWAIHRNSRRGEKNFVVVDCAALPEDLVESILFGHEKGSFTGADRSRDGLIKQADRGTLFLDEVAELPLSTQSSFLRVLHERRFRPIGHNQEIKSEFRLIAASNRNLDDLVKSHAFREDLLFRLRALTIEVPPLRERLEDVRELTRYYASKLCEDYGIVDKSISPEVFDVLARYQWPGNVRELVHSLERAISAAMEDPVLFSMHLPIHIRVGVARASVTSRAVAVGSGEDNLHDPKPLPKLQEFRETTIMEAEQQYLKDLLRLTGGNVPKACHISGLSRSRLYSLLKKYHLSTSG